MVFSLLDSFLDFKFLIFDLSFLCCPKTFNVGRIQMSTWQRVNFNDVPSEYLFGVKNIKPGLLKKVTAENKIVPVLFLFLK